MTLRRLNWMRWVSFGVLMMLRYRLHGKEENTMSRFQVGGWQDIPEEERGWKLEVDIDDNIEYQFGLSTRTGTTTKWFRLKFNGEVAFEAKLESFTVYMPFIARLQGDLDRLNKLIIAEENFQKSMQELGTKIAEGMETLAANLRKQTWPIEKRPPDSGNLRGKG